MNRDTLLAVGVCLVVVGVVLRGIARSSRRDLALRGQHRRDERKSNEAGLNTDLEQAPGWLDKNIGLLANLVLALGVVTALGALFRR